MKIASWNVNSIKSRLAHVEEWMKEHKPDVLLLQELKCVEADFPLMAFQQMGYKAAIHGQKSYNGVAIIAKQSIDISTRSLPGNDADEQSRYIEAVVDGKFRIASVYVPNGQSVGSEKFDYKMRFYDHLIAHFKNLLTREEPIIIGGDFNVAQDPIDVFDVKVCEGHVLYHPQERAKLRQIANLGYTDAFRALHPMRQDFSWWDYRAGAFEHNTGLRIDYIFASPQAADRLIACDMDAKPRGLDKPSDHIPVWCELKV